MIISDFELTWEKSGDCKQLTPFNLNLCYMDASLWQLLSSHSNGNILNFLDRIIQCIHNNTGSLICLLVAEQTETAFVSRQMWVATEMVNNSLPCYPHTILIGMLARIFWAIIFWSIPLRWMGIFCPVFEWWVALSEIDILHASYQPNPRK